MNAATASGGNLTKPTKGTSVSSVSTTDSDFPEFRYWLRRLRAVQWSPHDPEEPFVEGLTKPTEEHAIQGEVWIDDSSTDGSTSADPVVVAFRESFPPGVDNVSFHQAAMDAIKAGYPVRVWLGIVNEWAWWVCGEAEREKLLAEGEKEPIYTLGELALIVNMSDQAVKNMHALKRDMGAVIRPAGQDGKRKN